MFLGGDCADVHIKANIALGGYRHHDLLRMIHQLVNTINQ